MAFRKVGKEFRQWRHSWLLASTIVVVTVAIAAQQDQPSTPPMAPVLEAKAKITGAGAGFDLSARFGHDTVGLVAAREGRLAGVEQELARLGGQTLFRDDTIGYLRVRIALDRWTEFRQHSDIAAAQLDGQAQYRRLLDERWTEYPQFFAPGWRTATEPAIAPRTPAAPPVETQSSGPGQESREGAPAPVVDAARNARLLEAIDPNEIMGTAGLRRSHPTFDGRGTTIAIVERGGGSIDVVHPRLRTARKLDGAPIPKVARLLKTEAAMDGSELTSDVDLPYSLDAASTVTAVGDTLVRLPRTGKFRFGWLVARPGTIINFRIAGPPIAAGVLMDDRSGEVWIDSNQNHSFQDEAALHDYNDQRAPEDAPRVELPAGSRQEVVVTKLERPDRIRIHFLGKGSHSTRSASAAAGNSVGDRFEGVAPAARLIGVAQGWSMAATLEAYIQAGRDPAVDVIVGTFGVDSGLDAERELTALVLNRVAERYQKVIVVSAGNEAGGTETGDQPSARNVLTVGAYNSAAWVELYTGQKPAWTDNLWPISARGPGGNGQMYPRLVAPWWAITPGRDERQTYRFANGAVLRRGDAPGLGTSVAAPLVAGAAAVLISAARQEQLPHDPQRILWALTSSARWLPGRGPDEQGTGLIQTDAAWRLLKSGATPIEIEVAGTSRHMLDPFRAATERVEGIYEREGWAPGQSGVRSVVLKRTTGPAGAVMFKTTWLAPSPAFRTAPQVTLPLNTPVRLDVHVKTPDSGIYTSLLRLVDASTGLTARDVLVTIVSVPRDSQKAQVIRSERPLLYGERKDHAFFVPPGAQSTRVQMEVSGEPASISFGFPLGIEADRGADLMPDRLLDPHTGSFVFSFPAPMAGTWGVSASRHTMPPAPAARPSGSDHGSSYMLRVEHYRVSAELCAPQTTASKDTKDALAVRFTNHLTPLVSNTARTIAGTAARHAGSYEKDGLSQVFDLQVPEGSAMLDVEAKSAASAEAFMLYLFDCTTGHCLMHEQLMPALNEHRTFVRQPRPGAWKVVLARAPNTPPNARFTFSAFIADPAARWNEVGSSESRSSGESWQVQLPVSWTNTSASPDDAIYLELVDTATEAAERRNPLGDLALRRNFPASLAPLVVRRSDRWPAPIHGTVEGCPVF
jgi:subtilisin family serine protease